MSKKAKSKRKDQYKAFMEGMKKYREKFVTKKIALVDKMLADESLKTKIMNKKRTEMNKLERAAADTIVSREISNTEQFDGVKEKLKETQVKKSTFKYKPKLI